MKKIEVFISLLGLFFLTLTGSRNVSKIVLGAYYFDGWTGTYPYHITQSLKDSFKVREPKWGWITSKQEIVDQQVISASKMGLSFFTFCWYFNNKKLCEDETLNQALNFYKRSINKNKIKYCLMVANHKGFEIGPNDWEIVSDTWINNFIDKKSYLNAEGNPLLIFFSFQTLIEKFGSVSEVNRAFNTLREKAVKRGLHGVTIAACSYPNEKDIQLIEQCGFDVITGYNYHSAGVNSSNSDKIIQIDSLTKWEKKIWDKFKFVSKLKYIPVSTLNWDPRPWANGTNSYSKEIRYTGFSSESVYNSLISCKNWLQNNKNFTATEKIAILYAWNENGEGAWLTPGKNGFNPGSRIKKALKHN
ncbi:glycoside hydrolase family 99-like domain-containing protein [Emticicia sp. SJ17W-69]|uniref:glycoside hydrolase family 99-like domain-containing protein n=1 Tax=Emticicia sp. SJ17W-69 TaxID=3421657 RepID=UPI003EBBBBB1